MKEIEHIGKIVSISGHIIDVEMIVDGACSSCKAKAACGMGDSENRLVTVVSETPQAFKVGEQVMVMISSVMGLKAVLYAYIIPFIVLLGGLLAMLQLGMNEAVAGLAALGATVLYYLVLYFMKGQLDKEIIFNLRKI